MSTKKTFFGMESMITRLMSAKSVPNPLSITLPFTRTMFIVLNVLRKIIKLAKFITKYQEKFSKKDASFSPEFIALSRINKSKRKMFCC